MKRFPAKNLPRAIGIAAVSMFLAGAALAADPIKIGAVGPMTGPASTVGQLVRSTYELAVKRVNDAGGLTVDGVKRPVELIVADGECKPSSGVSAAQRLLTRDNVDILVADLNCSDVTLAVMELAPSYPNKTFYSALPVSTTISDKIEAAPEKYGNFWKWDGDSTMYGTSISDFLKEAATTKIRNYPNKTVAFVVEESDYAKTILTSTKNLIEKDGWKVVATEATPIGATDYYPQLTKIRGLQPDVVMSIFIAANSGIAYIRQSKEQGLKSDQIAIYYPGLTAFTAGIGNAADGLLYFSTAIDVKRSERGRQFASLMDGAKIKATGDSALGYCSATTLMDVIGRAGSLDRKKMESAFLATDDSSCPTYQRVVFDPKRHSPKLGGDYFFVGATQILPGAKDSFIVWPKKAATGKIDDLKQ